MECLETSEHSIMPYGTGAVSKTTPLLYCDNGRIHDIACFLNNCASHPLPGFGPHLKLTRHDMIFSQTIWYTCGARQPGKYARVLQEVGGIHVDKTPLKSNRADTHLEAWLVTNGRVFNKI